MTDLTLQEEGKLPDDWEALAKAVSEGATEHDIMNLSIALKIRPPILDAIKVDKRFAKSVEHKVRCLALYAVARNLPAMEVLAKKSVPAFTALAKLAGAWPGAQVNVQTNVTVGDRSGDNESDRAFHLAFQQRLRSGLVQRLIVLEGTKSEEPQGTRVEQPDSASGP